MWRNFEITKKKKERQDKMPCANTFQGAFVKEIISTKLL